MDTKIGDASAITCPGDMNLYSHREMCCDVQGGNCMAAKTFAIVLYTFILGNNDTVEHVAGAASDLSSSSIASRP